MPNDIPSWLSEPCPPWCVADHKETDHPADRVHDSAAVEVPGVILIRVADGDGVRMVPDAVGVYLERCRRVGERQDWVVLGTPTQYVDMSWETAQRVEEALSRLLGCGDRREE